MGYKICIFSIFLIFISSVSSNYKIEFLSENLNKDLDVNINKINDISVNEDKKINKESNEDDQGTKIRCMWFNTKDQIIYDLKLLQKPE